jgi:hypothetical protein
MSIIQGNALSNGSSGYTISRSLRFRSSASAYLNRTFGTPTTRNQWSWSGWVKRGTLGSFQVLFCGDDGSSNNFLTFRFSDTNTLNCFQISGGSYNLQVNTTAVFRDPAAWYHVVFVYNSPSATSTDRIQIYVNGTRQAVSYSIGPFAQNTDSQANVSSRPHAMGRILYASTNYLDGYMTEVNFIDGQALTPNSFGAVNVYGSWSPVRYGGSYGTNGFYLPFSNNASTTTLGNDFSGNSNNWTTNNISLTAGTTYDSMTDVPTLTSATAANYCTLNPLQAGNAPSNGNLSATTSGTAHRNSLSTMYFSTGSKFYYEITAPSVQRISAGMATSALSLTTVAAQAAFLGVYGDTTGADIYNGASVLFSQSAIAANDVFQFCIDASTGNAWFGRNNTFYSSTGAATGNPATGANPTWTGKTLTDYSPEAGVYDAGTTATANFGQRPFTYTPPSGFVALNTYNL